LRTWGYPVVPRLFIPAHRLMGGLARLTGAEVRHLRAMRLRPGAQITVFDDRNNEHDAVLRRIAPRAAEIEIRSTLPARSWHGPPIVLIAGILKGPRMDILVEKTTELGVSRIVPALTELTVARPRGTEGTRTHRWRRLAVSAATQCGRAQVPSIDAPVLFADAVRAVPHDALRVLLWEQERRVALPTIHTTQPTPATIVLATGPEGGFAATEVDLALAAGFTVSGLGPHILRAETAAIVALALCQLIWGELNVPAS